MSYPHSSSNIRSGIIKARELRIMFERGLTRIEQKSMSRTCTKFITLPGDLEDYNTTR